MSGQLVLVTGATGFIGFHVLLKTLDAGFNARVAVRSQAKADTLLANKHLQSRNASSRVSFVTVPDLTAPGAYDDAVKGVKYVIHVASPLAPDNLQPSEYDEKLIQPALKGTLGILESAHKTTGIERVVITSSVAAIVPFTVLIQPTDKVFDSESTTPSPEVSKLTAGFEAYGASKVIARNASEEWRLREKPAFDVVNINPSFVLGRDELAESAESLLGGGTNRLVLSVALGQKRDSPLGGTTVHVEDVARAHVLALDSKIPGNTSYALNSNNPTGSTGGSNFNDIPAIVAKNFPQAVANGSLPNDGFWTVVPVKYDASKTEKTFGFTHLSFEQQVKDVVGQFLELSQKAKI